MLPDTSTPIVFTPANRSDVDRDLADHAIALGRYDAALGHYQAILRAMPTDPDALLGGAMAQAGLEDYDAAEALMDRIDVNESQADQGDGMLALHRYGALMVQAENGNTPADTPTSEPAKPTADELLSKAHGHFLTALERNPECRACLHDIGLYHARHPDGDPAIGLESMSRASQRFQSDTLRAELLIKLGATPKRKPFLSI